MRANEVLRRAFALQLARRRAFLSFVKPRRLFASFASFAFFLLLSPAVTARVSFGDAERIDEDWRFALQDDPRAREPGFDDSAWESVRLPHDWSVKGALDPELASCTGYLPGGIGWYRKTIEIPERAGGEKVFLYFEGVYNRSDVYLNGQLLGHRPNGYVSFHYDATPHVRFGEKNVIAVRVDHSRSADSRWYTGSGIYRDVHLVRSGSVHLEPWGVFARPENVSSERAFLRVDTEVRNHTDAAATVEVRHELRSAEGTAVATAVAKLSARAQKADTASALLEVSAPRLWSVDAPSLYELRTTILRDGREIDRSVVRTGFRDFAFDPAKGFFLNGVSMKMKGVCLHHDAGVLGAAVPREVWRQRLLTLKEIGCNAIRTSHNPQATDLYELCDELGLLVLDEIFDEWEFAKRKWLKGWNVGEPGFEGSYDFFEEWSDRDVADWVRRDRNHVSIFAWSIGNEVDYPNDPYSHPVLDGSGISQPMFGGYKPEQPDANRLGAIAQRLVAEVKRHDVSRPVTAALAGVVMSNQTAYPAALDIVGYNYTEDRYAIDHATYPERVIYGSENRHHFADWKAVVENDHVFGQFLWTGIDYLGESGPWPSRGFYSGLVDLSGAVKPRGSFRQALWSEKPVLHLGTQPAREDRRTSIDAWPSWNYDAGARVSVMAYTNAARVQLLLDDQPIGDAKPYDHETGVLAWELPFAAGRLEAIGYDANGAETCRAILQTAGAPAAMIVEGEPLAIDRDRGVSILQLRIVDTDGVRVMDAAPEITCVVEGPARLLGLEAGNNRDMSDYTDAVHAAFRGRLVAYIEATGKPGPIRVRFTTPGLPDAVATIEAR
ncbi:glycoside hydrolase family 2 TIM barrel-domain containing protein [Opitutales bacterium ASA1]|nr:glycoside hydrolase family 2 TIM barrel-domain containing protein [Opitutales bacterium ASA1]